ncbi:histidinol-phosphatase [candidate division KSB1 bacterium]|nr:MAG: histidinol-phosphatase [candidate division KSB1 bacterium]
MKELTGAIHIHTKFSDGTKDVPEIIDIAREVGLDFLMFSDHHTLEPKRLGFEGWHGNLLVFIGYEINDKDDNNHYLAFNIEKELNNHLTPEEYVRIIKEKGGFGIIAHPDEQGSKIERFRTFPWKNWEINGYSCIEIWNQMSEWKEGLTKRNQLWKLLHPRKSLKGPKQITLKRWDEINKIRKVGGIGGLDVHAVHYRLFKIFPVIIYRYKVHFKSIRTHVLIDDSLFKNNSLPAFEKVKVKFYHSLSSGRCFISNFALGDARNFRFLCESGNNIVETGEDLIKNEGRIKFHCNLPLKGEVRLFKDSVLKDKKRGKEVSFSCDEPGIYRVEVYRKRKPWIYSNPIRVLKNE